MIARTSVRGAWTAEAAAVPAARHLVRGYLRDQQLDALVSDAELLVSELVGNVVLHVGGRVEVVATAADDEVLVEVTDESTVAPQLRVFSRTSSTGRGMRLVHSLAVEHGVRSAGAGKTVWVRVTTDTSRRTDDDLAESFSDVDWLADVAEPDAAGGRPAPGRRAGGGAAAAAGGVSGGTVVLRGYPVELGLSVAEHVEDWMREFALMALARGAGTTGHEVPQRLQDMVRDLSGRYARELSAPDRARAAAAARGDAAVDLVYPVREESARAALAWRELLREVDHYCAAEELLTLQRSPEQVALVDWLTDEFVRQSAGEPPRPWDDRRTGAGES